MEIYYGFDGDDIREIIENIVEHLCEFWTGNWGDYIEEMGCDLKNIDDEFNEWRFEFASSMVCHINDEIGMYVRKFMKVKFSEELYDEIDMYNFYKCFDRELRSIYNGHTGTNNMYSDVSALDILVSEYISDHKTDVSLKQMLKCNAKNIEGDYDEKMGSICQEWMFRKQDEYGSDMDWSIEDIIDEHSKFDNYDDEYTDDLPDFDEDEYKKITSDVLMEAYKKKIEAPIIKFQASCRRITEIWKFVRNMNELCSVGCGNWK
jgi:hypothetical protein